MEGQRPNGGEQGDVQAKAATEPAAAETDPCAELRRQVEELTAKSEQYLDQWRRSAAEFSNYKKRLERENAEFQRYALAGFIKKLLPVVDDLDRAFASLPEHLRGEGWVNGVDLVRQKLEMVLSQEGVMPIEVEEGMFDPSRHEAVTHEDSSELADGRIIGVVQRGYRIGDRVLRPAQVRVARHVESDKETPLL
jgi:molecular chaperone GrpE